MRKFAYSALLFFLFYAFPGYSTCIQGNCIEGKGTFAFSDGSFYKGEFSKGKADGFGTWCFENGDKYVGFFQDNLQHGKGVIYHNNGTETFGEWILGIYFKPKNGEIEGCLKGDCSDGFGTYVYEEGNAKYTGYFKNDMPHGQGVCKYSNGEFYDGKWENGSFNGVGILYLPDGSAVKGYWKDGTYVGKQTPQKPAIQTSVQPSIQPTAKPTNNIIVDNPMKTLKEIRSSSKTKVHALIIGISTYTHMPVLKYSDDDAYRMYAFLKSPEGGALRDDNIRMLIDEEATRGNIKKAMADLFMNAGEDDLILMYYSGHGLKDCFLPIDFDRVSNKLYHSEINQILRKSPAKYKLCIADACHSGGLAAKGENPVDMFTDEQLINSYYDNLAKSDAGTALILSSKLEEISLESSGLRQGVFSHFLIRGLEGEADQDRDKIVTVSELFNFISKNVKSYTSNRQSPIIRGTFDQRMTVSVVR